jgi:hypothetical protein
VNGTPGVTNLPYTYKVNSLRPEGQIGGSVFSDIYAKSALTQFGSVAVPDFIEWLSDLHSRAVAKSDAFLWSPAEFDASKAVDTSRGLANVTAIWGVWLDNDCGDLGIYEFVAMFPHLMMVIYNSSSSTSDAPRFRVVIPTTCAMTIDVHADIVAQIMKSLNRRGYYGRKQLEKRAMKGDGGKCHGFDSSKFTASSLFYLPAQAAVGPDASFFLTFDGGKRPAINPYQWIDKTIIDHRPEPEPAQPVVTLAPVSIVRKDPKLTRALLAMEAQNHAHRWDNYEDRVDAAINGWRQHLKGTGNSAFFDLAVALVGAGMERAEISRTLYAEAVYAHGSQSQSDRRTAIPHILKKIKFDA